MVGSIVGVSVCAAEVGFGLIISTALPTMWPELLPSVEADFGDFSIWELLDWRREVINSCFVKTHLTIIFGFLIWTLQSPAPSRLSALIASHMTLDF